MLAILVATTALTGCDSEVNPPPGNGNAQPSGSTSPKSTTDGGSAAMDKAGWPAKLRLGVLPTEGGRDSKARFEALAMHLENELGVPIEVQSATDYNGVITAMQNKHIEMAYFGPKSYTEAAEIAGAEAVVCELDEDKNPGYHGILISKKGSGIDQLDDIKGKTFCFTDPNSTSGCLVPSVLFYRDMKIKPEEHFKEVSFSGSHGASMLMVKNGRVEVAATNDIDMNRMIEKGALKKDDFTILWTSELIPGAPMCIRKDMPESLKKAFTVAMLKVNEMPDLIAKLANGGYMKTDDKAYDVIRYMKQLKARLQKAAQPE
jgi:phosphonate transport system substrate-binding protein